MKLVLFGAPGSGKGTQAVVLCKEFSLVKISLGDILRQEVKNNTDLGKEVNSYMVKGALVPDELVTKVIEASIPQDNFLLEGYPRNFKQAQTLDKILKSKKIDIDAFIYLDIDEATIINRLSKRRVCSKCGANYHLENIKPKKEGICDCCNSPLTQRKDDTLEVIKNRWQVYIQESEPILDFYNNKNKVIKVDSRKSVEEVLKEIKKKMNLK